MITFVCKCGKSLRVKDELAGKRARCPACSQVVVVPQGAAGGDSLNVAVDEAAQGPAAPSSLCPHCHVELPAGAVLCTTCGFDTRTGKQVVGRVPLLERIPWGTVRSVGSAILLLAILAVGVYLLITEFLRPGRPAEPSKGVEEKKAATPEAAAAARPVVLAPTFVRVRCVAKGPEPALAEGFVFRGANGDYTAKKLTDLLVARMTREAADSLYLAGYTVLRKGDALPQGPAEELALVLDAELGWVYREQDGQREPAAACIKTCVARLVRSSGVPLWQTKEGTSDERPDTEASAEALARLAKLKGVRTDLDYDKVADQAASRAAGRALAGVPGPAVVAETLGKERTAEAAARQILADFDSGKADMAKAAHLVASGNPYLVAGFSKRLEKIKDPAILAPLAAVAPDRAVAQRAAELYVKSVGSGPRASAAAGAIEAPERLLLGPLRASFAKASGSFAWALPLVDATAKTLPHLALAYARTAARLDADPAIQKAYRTLCIEIEARKERITVEEIKLMADVAAAEPASLLGRTMVLAALETGGFSSEFPAASYLGKVAAKCVPDAAEPWPDGSLRLSDEQMAMLQTIARRDENLGENTAIALLLRVGGDQREEVRKLIKITPPFDDPVLGPVITDLQSDDTTKVRNAITHGIPKLEKAHALAPLMAEAYFKHEDPTTKATALYGLFSAGGQAETYQWALFRMLASTDMVERRSAAAMFARIGRLTIPFYADLRAAAAKETDPQSRRSLDSALSQAATFVRQMVDFRDHRQPR